MPDKEKNVKQFYETYSACFQRIRNIENELHTPQQNSEEWFQLLVEKSQLLRSCYIKNEEMLSEYVYPYIEDPTKLEEKSSRDMVRENDRLLHELKCMDYLLQDDLACAIRSQIRKEWSLEDQIELSYQIQIIKGSYFDPQKLKEAIEEGTFILSFAERIEEFPKLFEHVEEVKSMILRSAFNTFFYEANYQYYLQSYEFERLEEHIKRFEKIGTLFAPYLSETQRQLRQKSEYQTGCTIMDLVMSFDKQKYRGKKEVLLTKKEQEIREELVKKAKSYLRLGGEFPASISSEWKIRMKYAENILGECSVQDYYDFLWNLYQMRPQRHDADQKLYGTEDFQYYITVNIELAYMLEELPISKEKKQKKQDALFQETVDFLCQFPQKENNYQLLKVTYEYLCDMLPVITNPEQLMKCLFQLLAHEQTSTSIHIRMVSLLAEEFTKGILNMKPEIFIGTFQYQSTEEVFAHQEEILSYIRYAALLHDVGKIPMWDFVNLQRRKISNNEFRTLKQHPTLGYQLLASNAVLEKYADVAYCHHKYYDGTGGYPPQADNVNSPYRIFIDIVTLADCMDAATDRLGRNYSEGKTFDQLMGEFQRGAGHRYSDVLVKILTDSDSLQNHLREITTQGRKNIFKEIYQNYVAK
ncbi:MAG: HD-GYP domain-containing protein [Lachnospiraceae bacterium]